MKDNKQNKQKEIEDNTDSLFFSILKSNEVLFNLTPEYQDNPQYHEALKGLQVKLYLLLDSFRKAPDKSAIIQQMTLLIYDFIAQQEKILKLRGKALNKRRERKQRLMKIIDIEYYLQKTLRAIEEDDKLHKPNVLKAGLEFAESMADFIIAMFAMFDTYALLLPELEKNKALQESLDLIYGNFWATEDSRQATNDLKGYSFEVRSFLNELVLKPVAQIADKLAQYRKSKIKPSSGMKL